MCSDGRQLIAIRCAGQDVAEVVVDMIDPDQQFSLVKTIPLLKSEAPGVLFFFCLLYSHLLGKVLEYAESNVLF